MKKLRVSTWIGISAVTLAAGGYFGVRQLSSYLIGREHFSPVAPGTVNLVGISPGRGYRIIIANDVAQLVETQGDFKGDSGSGSAGPTEGAIKKRVPMREMLGVLRGDGKSLGNLVMIMNEMQESDEWPPTRIYWKKDDLEKAITGDLRLRNRLEHDLNVKLNGMPLPQLNRNSLENGIFIVAPVEMEVEIDGKKRLVKGETLQPFKPNLIRATEGHYQDKANVDDTMIAGYYGDEAKTAIENPTRREDVAKSIRQLYSKKTMEDRLQAPRHLLESATVVLNQSFVEDASYRSYKTNDGKTLCDLTVDLNDEGRRRLWKYSHNRVGSQILLIADDIAIAAPRIEHELALSELTITQMPDETLVRDAVQSIKNSRPRTAAK
jgi:hypothetical protein